MKMASMPPKEFRAFHPFEALDHKSAAVANRPRWTDMTRQAIIHSMRCGK